MNYRRAPLFPFENYVFFGSPKGFRVVPRRVELRTSTLSVWRSNQLSYETIRQLPNIY